MVSVGRPYDKKRSVPTPDSEKLHTLEACVLVFDEVDKVRFYFTGSVTKDELLVLAQTAAGRRGGELAGIEGYMGHPVLLWKQEDGWREVAQKAKYLKD